MTAQPVSLTRLSNRSKTETAERRERVDRLQLPEQSTGPIPLRGERPAAEILAERLREAGPDGLPQAFVP